MEGQLTSTSVSPCLLIVDVWDLVPPTPVTTGRATHLSTLFSMIGCTLRLQSKINSSFSKLLCYIFHHSHLKATNAENNRSRASCCGKDRRPLEVICRKDMGKYKDVG